MFSNRTDAGAQLAARLPAFPKGSAVVLALPRGGVPVAAEIARSKGLPLDLVMVRKVGLPGHSELAVAAIAGPDGEEMVINRDIAGQAGLDRTSIERLAAEERTELRRRQRIYLGSRPAVALTGRTAILVDDGVATGATLLAAIRALRRRGPARFVVAVPVASPEALALLRAEVDEVICLEVPQPFYAVGAHYRDFPQVSDEEVTTLLSGLTDAGTSAAEEAAPNG